MSVFVKDKGKVFVVDGANCVWVHPFLTVWLSPHDECIERRFLGVDVKIRKKKKW